MERFGDKIFLLCRQAGSAWPVWKHILYYVWRAGLLVCAGICMGVLVLGFGYGSFTWDLYLSYFNSWDLLWLNILPVVLLGWGLLGRAWAAFLLGGGTQIGAPPLLFAEQCATLWKSPVFGTGHMVRWPCIT